jgi:hypothetical protein
MRVQHGQHTEREHIPELLLLLSLVPHLHHILPLNHHHLLPIFSKSFLSKLRSLSGGHDVFAFLSNFRFENEAPPCLCVQLLGANLPQPFRLSSSLQDFVFRGLLLLLQQMDAISQFLHVCLHLLTLTPLR